MHPDFTLLARLSPETDELIVCYANPAAERLLGAVAKDIVGRPLRELLADATPFASRDIRLAFFARLREQQDMAFPGTVDVTGAESSTRKLRIRLKWPQDSDYVLVVGEDTTSDPPASKSAAVERFDATADVSALMSHHLNNVLAAALLDVEMVRSALELQRLTTTATHDACDSAITSISTAAEILSSLTEATRLHGAELGACDLRSVTRVVLAGPETAPPDDAPCWVTGNEAQLEVILHAFATLLDHDRSSPVVASMEARGAQILLRLQAQSQPGDDVVLQLLDPARGFASVGREPVELYAGTLLLLAIGGSLGLPRVAGDTATVELTFRAASPPVPSAETDPRVLIVSADGALRATLSAMLAPWALEYTDNARDGLARALRPDGGVVLCDIDDQPSVGEEIVSLYQRLGGDRGHRLIIASRDAAKLEGVTLPRLHVPAPEATLRKVILEAAG